MKVERQMDAPHAVIHHQPLDAPTTRRRDAVRVGVGDFAKRHDFKFSGRSAE
jgi:hypothetical protein